MKEIIKRIIVTLLVVALAIATAALLRECVPGQQLKTTASIVFEVCTSIVIIASLLGLYTSNKTVDKSREGVDVGQWDREVKEYRERAEKDYESEKKRILRYINLGTVYFWFIYLALFVGITTLLILGEDNEFRGFFIVFLVWLYGLNGPACLKIDVDNGATRIKEKEYPILSGIVKDVFCECGVRGRVKLFMKHSSSSEVAKSFGAYHVGLGAKAIALFDEQEIRQMLYHEAAHIKSKDIHLSYRLAKGYEKWNHFSDSSLGFALIAPVYILCYLYDKEYVLFDETSSHTIEVKADQFAATVGTPQDAINGLAKILMFECSLDEYVGDGRYYCFRPEKVEKGVYRKQIQEYKDKLPEKEAGWRKHIENTLLVDVSSHPTFSERMAIMGVEDYQICFKENDPAYEEERQRLLDAIDQELYDDLLPNYEQLREDGYLIPLAKITAYKAGELGNDLMTKIQIAQLCEDIFLYDDAYALYEEIRKEDPANATAAYAIGRIKLMRNDDSGIQDIYASLSNHNDTDEKLELIGDYCVEMGLAEEYEHWLQFKNEKLNYYFNSYDKICDCWDKEILSTSDLHPGQIERRRREILELGQGMIGKIYLVKKELSDDCKMNTFLLRPNNRAEVEEWEEMMERVFLLLDNNREENVQYGLRCLWDEPELEKIVSRIEGTCIFVE